MTSVKVITDRKFMFFFEKNPIENVSVCDATKLGGDEEIVREVEGVNLLFIVTNEIIADEISRIADSCKVDLILMIVCEKFERHARRYVFEQAHSTTAVPYSSDQNEICYKIIKAIADSVNNDKIEFEAVLNLFYGSEYFEYKIGEVNSGRVKWVSNDLQLGDVVFKSFGGCLYEVLNLKVVSTGKKHLTGKIDECIAYDDIEDLKTDADMELSLKGIIDFLFLIVEPDKQNLWKYRRLIRMAQKYREVYPYVITISIPRDDSIGNIGADINVRTNDLQSFYEDFIYRLDRRLKFDDDEINTLIEYRKVRMEYFKFEPDGDNARLKEFVYNLRAKEMFMYIWFDYYDFNRDSSERWEEWDKILKLIDEVISPEERRRLHCGMGECLFGLGNKVLIAFYIKE